MCAFRARTNKFNISNISERARSRTMKVYQLAPSSAANRWRTLLHLLVYLRAAWQMLFACLHVSDARKVTSVATKKAVPEANREAARLSRGPRMLPYSAIGENRSVRFDGKFCTVQSQYRKCGIRAGVARRRRRASYRLLMSLHGIRKLSSDHSPAESASMHLTT